METEDLELYPLPQVTPCPSLSFLPTLQAQLIPGILLFFSI
jgi:hypothetical protein